MISKDFKALAMELEGILLNGEKASATFRGVAIDSRAVRGEQLFVAIVGANNDGHRFINDAIKNHCAGLLINHDFSGIKNLDSNMPVVSVQNTHAALIALARNYRRESHVRLIALTGSNGKTTTKELIYALLRQKSDKTYRSPGNFNNLYGLPLSLFEMPDGTEFAVFELGISIPDEMRQLAEIAQADLALITNIGPTHLATLGTLENVAEEKFHLIDSISSDKPAVINADDPVLMKAASKRNREFITFGFNPDADIVGKPAGFSDDGFPLVEIDGNIAEIRLFGSHQAYNMLAAYSACKGLGLDISSENLNNISYDFAQYRGEIKNISGLTVIADCYNANPVSMESGLRSFRSYLDLPSNRNRTGIAVVGDMLELGENASLYHTRIGQLIGQLGFGRILTVGPLSEATYETALQAGINKDNISHFADAFEAGEFLIGSLPRGGVIYLKASRGIGLEKIITLLEGTAFRNN